MDQCLGCTRGEEGTNYLLIGAVDVSIYLRLKLKSSDGTRCPRNEKLTIHLGYALTKATLLSNTLDSAVAPYIQLFLAFYDWVGFKRLLAATLFRFRRLEGMLIKFIDKIDAACCSMPPEDCGVMFGRAGASQAVWFL
jgi:hypothetical protein